MMRSVNWSRRRVGAIVVIAAILLGTPMARGETLREQIANLARRYERASGAVAGVSVRRCQTGRDVAGVRADSLFIPASNQKLLTGAYALGLALEKQAAVGHGHPH